MARAIPLALQDEALVEFREAFADGEEGAAFPTEDLVHLIDRNYLTRLDRAPLSMKDAKLVPEAGPCTSCPKRSGNQPALFPDDTPKDTCTDAVCFRSKLSAPAEARRGRGREGWCGADRRVLDVNSAASSSPT